MITKEEDGCKDLGQPLFEHFYRALSGVTNCQPSQMQKKTTFPQAERVKEPVGYDSDATASWFGGSKVAASLQDLL